MSDEQPQIPAVTLIICNNTPQKTLDSLVLQDYPNFGIILAVKPTDDLSWGMIEKEAKDNVVGILKYKDCQIAFVHQLETVAKTLNQIIQLTLNSTHIYGFIFDELGWNARKVSRCVSRFLKYPEHIGVVYTDTETFFPIFRPQNFAEWFPRNFFVGNIVFKNMGGFNEGLQVGEEMDFIFRVGQKFIISHLAENLCVTS